MKLCFLLSLCLCGAIAVPFSGASSRSVIVIDGHNETIATATAKQISGWSVALSFADLIVSIIVAFNEPAFDYWGNVQEDVEALVNTYINQHNMNQVVAYTEDLETLLLRYLEAPVTSDNYPDKNQQASALSMAIIAHRYLVMSGDMRYSLILHFEDIASMHIVVLKDAAETYSSEGSPSLWWVDLDDALDEYITYSDVVKQELRDFRIGMVNCEVETDACREGEEEGRKTCYDIYTIYDGVTEETSECRQLTGAADCIDHCNNYIDYRNLEIDQFESLKVDPVTTAWRELKEISSEMAAATGN